MELFLIQYDNGLEDERGETKILGIYDSLEKAISYLLSEGFRENETEVLFFPRYEDFAEIHPFKLNAPVGKLYKRRNING